jgi:hypothetical protein
VHPARQVGWLPPYCGLTRLFGLWVGTGPLYHGPALVITRKVLGYLDIDNVHEETPWSVFLDLPNRRVGMPTLKTTHAALGGKALMERQRAATKTFGSR